MHSQNIHSWCIENSNIATKTLDKSAFLHHGMAIPKEIRWFFLNCDFKAGERVPITLRLRGQEHKAHIEMENHSAARTRLYWSATFALKLHRKFPTYCDLYLSDKEPPAQVQMRLERLDMYRSYSVSFHQGISEALAASDIEAEKVEEDGLRYEGGLKEYYGKTYERDPRIRQLAIQYHGLKCSVCGFDFEEMYGERGRGYIEVHHIRPISSFEGRQSVDPKTDLVSLCSNCHRMVHRRPGAILTVEQVLAILKQQVV